MDRKPRIEASTYPLVKYPKMHENIVTICLVLSEKMEADYGGLLFGVSTDGGRKVWNIWNLFGKSSFRYSSVRISIYNGASSGLGWICNI